LKQQLKYYRQLRMTQLGTVSWVRAEERKKIERREALVRRRRRRRRRNEMAGPGSICRNGRCIRSPFTADYSWGARSSNSLANCTS
jgi:hypothetical protein